MTIDQAQREVRMVFMGGFPGQLVSSGLWFLSAALGTWVSPKAGIAVLVLGGMCIFPVTQLLLRLAGRRTSLSPGNPMGQLARQVAFTIPLALPVVAGAAMHRLNWFYPGCMVIAGAHYLPFSFLYGMWQFGVLSGILVAGGVLTGLYLSEAFSAGGWFTAAVLLVFAFVGRAIVSREERRLRHPGGNDLHLEATAGV